MYVTVTHIVLNISTISVTETGVSPLEKVLSFPDQRSECDVAIENA